MKKLFGICGIAAAMVALVLLITGGGRADVGGAATGPMLDPNVPVTITYWYPLNAGSNTADVLINGLGTQRMYDRTGVTVQWEVIPAAGTDERFNLMMASRAIPDVVAYNVRGLKQYYEAFQPIDTFIQVNPGRYPNMNRYFFNDEYLDAYLRNEDGHLRIVPMLATRRTGDILILRQDLLQRYNGGVAPATLDDWYRLLVTARDDGKVPYMTRMQRAGILFRLLSGYIDCVIEDYFVEDGVVKYGVLDPRLREAVEIARRWYAEGLIDREYPSTDSTRWWEAVLRGDVFATHDNIMRINAGVNDFINNQVPPSSARLMGVGPMQSPRTGLRHTVIHYPRVRDKSSSISINARNPERILDFFEFCFTEEGFILTNFGLEGLSFNYVNGIPIPDPTYSLRQDRGEVPPIGSTYDMPKNQRDELFSDYEDPRLDNHILTRQARDLYASNDFIRENWIPSLSFTDAERNTLVPLNAELDTYRSEMLDRFIMGIEPMGNWDNFVAQVRRMNVDAGIRIHQDALNRMLRR